MSSWKAKGKEIVRAEAALLGDHEEEAEARDEAKVWRHFREAGLLDESVLERRGKTALLQRISELEKELYDYQYHMGLLLIDKKEWSSKYEMLRQELAEAIHNQKRLRIGHIVAVSEFEKKEKSMRNTVETQKQSINSLKSASSDVQGKHAEAEPGNKSPQVQHLEENIEEKYLEDKLKVHTLNASLAEASRKSSEINRRLEDVEAREGKFQKEYSSFFSKKRKFEEDHDRQKEDILAWERELQECQKKLSKGQYSLDDRETEINDREMLLKKREKELEEAWKNLWVSDDSLKLKEQDISMRIQALENKEKVEISKLIDYQTLILECKKKDIELNKEEENNSLNKQLRMKLDLVSNKEVTVENIEKEIFEREQVLEREIMKLKDKEKENEKFLNSLKESLAKQLEDLRRDRDKFEKEWELLDERQLSLEMALEQFNCDKERFAKWKHIEEEKMKHEKLEMTDRLLKLLEDLKQEKRSFEDVIACLKSDKIGIQKGESINIASYCDANDTLNDKERLEATKDGMSTDLNAPRSLKFDVILSAKSAEASPQSTYPQSVSLEGHTSWLHRCSRLLGFSSDKRVAQPTGTQSEEPTPSDVCLCVEALRHKTSDRPEELLQVVNVSSDTLRIQTIGDPIILEGKRSCRVNDTTEPSSGIAHSSTNILMSQPNNDPIGSSDKEASSMHHEIDSAHNLFKKRRWRSGSVFVKKSRSVNALLEDDKASSSQQYSQQKDSGCSTSEEKVRSANVEQKATDSIRHLYDKSRARNNELDSEELDEDYHSLSSQEYVKGGYRSPEIEVPGLKHYNFRHTTIMRAVSIAETLADRVKRRKKEENLQSHEKEMHKVIPDDEEENDDEEEMEHGMESSDSDWLESQLRDT